MQSIIQFHLPFNCVVSGISSSGKSTFVRYLIEHREYFFSTQINKVLYCYGIWTDSYNSLEKDSNIEFFNGIPDEDTIKSLPRSSLIVIEDLIAEIVQDVNIQSLFLRISHHNQLGVLYTTQNLYAQGRSARNINLNTHYIVLTKNPRDIQQISFLGRQLGMRNMLLEAYNDAMLIPFNHLVICLSPYTTTDCKLFSQIYNTDRIIGYIAK